MPSRADAPLLHQPTHLALNNKQTNKHNPIPDRIKRLTSRHRRLHREHLQMGKHPLPPPIRPRGDVPPRAPLVDLGGRGTRAAGGEIPVFQHARANHHQDQWGWWRDGKLSKVSSIPRYPAYQKRQSPPPPAGNKKEELTDKQAPTVIDYQSSGSSGVNRPLAIGLGVAIGIPSVVALGILSWCYRRKQRRAALEKRRRRRLDFVIT